MLKLDLDPAPAKLRQFAFVAVPGLPLIAVVVLRIAGHGWAFGHPAVLAALGVGILQALALLAGFRGPSRALYVVLMLVALPIGFVLSHVLMAAIFYLVITPIGLIFRLLGRDAMCRKKEPGRVSYWTDRGPARSPASYFKLY
jgi:hypothetical protein